MTELAVCFSCRLGYHDECIDPLNADELGTLDCCCGSVTSSALEPMSNPVGRPSKDLADIKDKTSAGRKRAAQIAPIFPGMLCEWAFLRNAGGGVQPIVGCQGNRIQEKGGDGAEFLQGDLHHGPNKSTLENTPGINLHRICASCHHRWHGLNDRAYGKDRPTAEAPWWPSGDFDVYAHDPVTEASADEYEASEAYWATRTEQRGAYPIPLADDLTSVRK